MQFTQIIATIGAASEKERVLAEMVKVGMNVARINFSHDSIKIQKRKIDTIRKVNSKYSKNIGILTDLKGPEIRIDRKDVIELKKGDVIYLSRKEGKDRIKLSDGSIIRKLSVGSKILIDDGNCEIVITEKSSNGVKARAENDCIIKPKKSVASQFITSDQEAITEFDASVIKMSVKDKVDYIALSHIRSSKDVEEARSIIGSSKVIVISKIENSDAVKNLRDIIKISDGIMVARGDLGMNIPLEFVPVVQERIIRHCKKEGKFSIVATQMMESMTSNKRPTRAEVNDVYTAVVQGADAVMLSGETAIGKYPVESVDYMRKIIKVAEARNMNKEKLDISFSERTNL